MQHDQFEQQFREKLQELYHQRQSLQDRFRLDEFVNMFTVQYGEDGLPLQPVEPIGKDVDSVTFQKVLAAFNDIYP